MRRKVTEDDVVNRMAEVFAQRVKPRLGGTTTPGGTGNQSFQNPMTAPGDLIRGGEGGGPVRLPIGTTGQVLTVSGGLPAWQAAPTSYPGDEYIQDMIATFLQAGANITLTYNDAANTLTIAVSGLTSYPGDEYIQDMLSTFLVAGTGMTLTYDDVANTLTLTSTGGYTDEQAQDAVGSILTDSASIDFTYDDAANTITAQVIFAGTGTANTAARSDHQHQNVPTGLAIILDGGGQAITPTQPQPIVRVPFACTVTGWFVNADQAGSIVVDVQRAASGTPTSFSSIAGTEKPTLSSQQSNQDTSLTTWTTSLSQGDWLRFVVESAATVKLVSVNLHIERTI